MPAPFKVKAVYDYASPHDDDLNFPNGQIITVTEEEDDDWYTGEYVDSSGTKQEGIFPRNFVEKYEPEVPSRPARPSKPKKEPAPDFSKNTEPIKETPPASEDNAPEVIEETAAPLPTSPSAPSAAQPTSELSSQSKLEKSPQVQSQETISKPTAGKPAPPKVAEKPSGGTFKDRIAAFNKTTAPPITPFKPGGQGGSGSAGFIKKPFVAPPPSKNAYVPPPREPPPQKVYRREEEQAVAETEGQVPEEEHISSEPVEEQPKPTSLKDRIALLQKQQLEQAARNAEKKEKPKRPPKKRFDSKEQVIQEGESLLGASQDLEESEPMGKKSVDFDEDTSTQPPRERQAPVPQPMATPPPPSRELMSDTNDADYSAADDTEEAEETSTSREESHPLRAGSGTHPDLAPEQEPIRSEEPSVHAAISRDDNSEVDEDEDEEEDDDVDPEVKRRMEIRERMAKMSGGMGMMGMFGAPGGMPSGSGPKKTKSSGETERKASANRGESTQASQAPPVPIMALPGMSRMKSPEATEPEAEVEHEASAEPERTPTRLPTSNQRDPELVPDVEDVEEPPASRSSRPSGNVQGRAPPPPPPETRPAPPSVPQGRTTLPSPPPEARRVPTIPNVAAPLSAGEDSDDEMSRGASRLSLDQTISDSRQPPSKGGPSVPTTSPLPPSMPSRPPRTSTDASLEMSPTGSSPSIDRRSSRGPPPIPVMSPPQQPPATLSRPPPPPPPGQPPVRTFTGESRTALPAAKHQVHDDSEEEVTEYDGDYDTDIASSAKHKDALKAHGRDSSLDDDGTITDEATAKSPTSPPARGPPPLPPTNAPREVPPPPPPSQPPKASRASADIPRAAPPPVPATREPPVHSRVEDPTEYDPFRYSSQFQPSAAPPPPPPGSRPPPVHSPAHEREEEDMYGASPPSSPRMAQSPPERNLPPHPPTQPSLNSPPTKQPRQSLDVHRSATTGRRSMEQSRPSTDTGFMASDIDLGDRTKWWTQDNTPPPSLQNRRDILYEMESTSTPKRGGKTAINKAIYVLYMDYSQTTITATFDASDPTSASLEQKHDRPPPPLRQDQLESASLQFGARLSEAVTQIQNTTVGDGTPHSLIIELLKPLSSTALLPIGTRAYGAPVYANLANASIQQFDEIRAGDIVTFRNARFQGHKGTMHAKYTVEVGKPDHVGVVVDWDGTKKKIRAWEQGRESKKVKVESYKVGDLRSGECRVWRVVGRGWVGWTSE